MRKRVWATCAALYFLSQLFFLVNIQFPRGHNFDEFHYVPAAKQFLSLQQTQNWEHPPLAKLIMAVGIGLWGDIPIGWRFMSTVFGSLTLVGMYLWALALFRSRKTALWVALATLFNQLLYVQARIGMLDTFMFAFIAWGLAAFTASWDPAIDPRRARRYLAATGALLGLGAACKWFAIVPWVTCLGLVGLVRLFQHWRVRFAEEAAPALEEPRFFDPGLWRGVRLRDWALFLGLLPVLAYFSTFIPYFVIQKPPMGLWDLILSQKRMYAGQLRVISDHPYMSQWMDWPLLKRPIWYAFDKEGARQEYVRGVLLLGNPLLMWGGIVALLGCLWGWVHEKSRAAFLILVFYGCFYVSWILIPRKVAFYYYYYPAGMMMSLTLAYVFQGTRWARWILLGAAIGVFVYFFPIMAALRIPSETFRKWMWFRSWI